MDDRLPSTMVQMSLHVQPRFYTVYCIDVYFIFYYYGIYKYTTHIHDDVYIECIHTMYN